MERLLYDFRHAWRQNLRRPLFTLVAVLSIAIGIGTNTTLFAVIDTMLLRPPAGIGDVSRTVEVTRTTGGRGRDTFSWPEFMDLRVMTADAFEELAAWNNTEFSWASDGTGERLPGMLVSHNYFAALGVQPVRGRLFVADEDRVPMTHPVAIVSETFWRNRLGARPDVIGSTIALNRHTFTIVGVVPAAFRGHVIGFAIDAYVPMMMRAVVRPGFDAWDRRWANWFTIVGRLREGVTAQQAQSAAQVAFTRMPQSSTDPRNARSAAVDRLGALPAAGRGPVGAFLGVLLGMVGIILLVTCANVAGMLLARAAGREREIAVRLALGSGRGRLVRQLLAESLVLFAMGGALGVALAVWFTGLLGRMPLPTPVSFHLEFAPDVRVLGAGLALALLTGVLFGLAPALQSTRADLAAMMRSGAASVGRSGRLRSTFVMGQVGLSLLLLLSAGLFLRSLQRAAAVSAGFDATDSRVVAFDLAIDGYDSRRGTSFVADVVARLEGAPGMEGAAAADDLPLDLSRSGQSAFVASPRAGDDGSVDSEFNIVTPGYFDVLRIRLLEGRVFGAGDVDGAQPVAIVSRTFAERTWPGEAALGKVLRTDSATAVPRIVVGVVEDVKNSTLMEEPARMFYLPLAQAWTARLQLVGRARPGLDAGPVMLAVLRETDPALSLGPLQSLEAVTALGLMPQRLAATVTTALGALALLLSTLGVYGVVAYTVVQRTREIGVRMALGARTRAVVWGVIKGGLRLAAPGLVLGLLAGFALSRVLRSFLLGLAPGDPVTFIAIPGLLLVMVVVACWMPARRAAAVQPAEALRAE